MPYRYVALSTAGETYGAVRADLERRGEIIGNNDLWIAAPPAGGLILATNNPPEFARIPWTTTRELGRRRLR